MELIFSSAPQAMLGTWAPRDHYRGCAPLRGAEFAACTLSPLVSRLSVGYKPSYLTSCLHAARHATPIRQMPRGQAGRRCARA
eukprot:scaffold80783_cov35-Tisochrysis_lutea.AAC.2